MTTQAIPDLVAVESPAPRAIWRSCYLADSTAVPTQSPAWIDAMERSGGWRDASRWYRFADGSELVLPLVRRTGLGRVGLRASMPDAWGYGGLVGHEVRADHVAAVLRDLGNLSAGWVRVRPSPLHAEAWSKGASLAGAANLLAVPRRAHVLSLDLPADETFRTRFTSSCRRAVRSAEKSGLEVEVDDQGRLVPIFHELLMCSVERWAGNQHEPLALARWRANRRDPASKFDAWSKALDGGCRILVARRDGDPIAAMIVLQDRNAHMTRSAMDRDKVGHDRPNELLMWRAIQDATEAGCGSFHLGESGTSTSLSRYKEKYGAVPMDYAEHRVEQVPATRIDASVRSGVKRVIGFDE